MLLRRRELYEEDQGTFYFYLVFWCKQNIISEAEKVIDWIGSLLE